MLDARVLDSQPTWWKEIDPTKHYLVLGDDADSFMSCRYLMRKHEGLQIGGFYDFKKGLYLNREVTDGKEPIYVDCSMAEGKCFDNHFTIFVDDNPEMINPNKGANLSYFQKYNGSVITFLLALYDEDMAQYDEDKLKMLLTVDSFYKGVYNKGGKWADVNYTWFDKLGMLDVFKPITDECNEQDFVDIYKQKAFNRHFEVGDEGYIKIADNDVSTMKGLPTYEFELVMPLQQGRTEANCSESEIRERVEDLGIVSLSQVYGGVYQYSYTNN